MKILFVTNMFPSLERPGFGAFVWQQAEQLRQFGHSVDVINITGFNSKLDYLRGAREVFQKTRRATYDVVHAHYGLSGFSALFRINAPLVLTLHGSDVLGSDLGAYFSRIVWRFADSVIVVSKEMQKRIPGTVIPCGVDLNTFKPYDRVEARTRLGWPKGKLIVLFPFDPARSIKRYDLASAAVDRIASEGFNVHLQTISNADNREMPWYYSAADAMILCSDREGSPTSVKEALACNLPVVATNVGDIQEILDTIAGVRICTHEVDDIARNLREVLEQSQIAKFDGRSAMLRYDQAVTVEKIVDVYKEVLHRRGATTAQLTQTP